MELVLRLLISFVIWTPAAVKPPHLLPLTHAQQRLMPSEGDCVKAFITSLLEQMIFGVLTVSLCQSGTPTHTNPDGF